MSTPDVSGGGEGRRVAFGVAGEGGFDRGQHFGTGETDIAGQVAALLADGYRERPLWHDGVVAERSPATTT